MKLTLAGELRTLEGLEAFAAEYGLPPEFGTPLFTAEPANHSPIWQTQTDELAQIQLRLPTLLPRAITLANLNTIPQTMGLLLHGELLAVAAGTDLTRDEVEFTADDCRNTLEAVAYKLIQLSYTHGHDKAAVRRDFNMADIYQEVLDSSVLVNERADEYVHKGELWAVQLIQSVYGPIGLAVTTAAGQTRYVADDQLAFPGIQFVAMLALAIGGKMAEGFVRNNEQ